MNFDFLMMLRKVLIKVILLNMQSSLVDKVILTIRNMKHLFLGTLNVDMMLNFQCLD